ncbi:MAG: hypothetical protein C0505_11570 [Leptothrix sp. (in: Bacteria)]|nr:hypothetical protein [Leptothrix sp. (in: b-proteobacteria)]
MALHVLGLAAALRLGAWQDRSPPPRAQAPLLVWLQAPPALAAAPGRPPPAHQATARPQATPAAARQRPAPQAITLPSPSAANDVQAAAGAASAAEPVAPASARAAGQAPLNLTLPRGASAPWRQRHPGLDDTRANTARATLDSRIAAALGGSDRITEERLSDGRMRFRRGNDCVVVHPSRAQGLEPWNGSVMPKMRGVEKC